MALPRDKSYFFKLTPARDRFLKGDRPTQETFREFADSVPFKLELDDTASENVQGLVKLAKAIDIQNQADPADGFSYAVQPSQLPAVKNGNQTIDDYNGENGLYNQASAFDIKPSDTTAKRDYEVFFNNDFILWLKSRLFPSGGTTGQVVVKNDNNQQSYNYSWQNLANSNEFITALLNNTNFLSQLNSKTEPVGTIKMARNITIGPEPEKDFDNDGLGKGRWLGWALCNGEEHNNYLTADLRGRFVVGYDPSKSVFPENETGQGENYGKIDNTGGKLNVTLSISEMPLHNHSNGVNSGTTNVTGAHTHTFPGEGGWKQSGDSTFCYRSDTGTVTTSSNGAHSHELNVNMQGGGLPHENRPPYYVLAYVEKIS